MREATGLLSLAVAVAALALALATGEGSRRVLRELAEAVNPNMLVLSLDFPLSEAQMQLFEQFNGAIGLTLEELRSLEAIDGVTRTAMRGNRSFATYSELRILEQTTDENFGPLLNLPLAGGEWFDRAAVDNALPVTVIGAVTAREYFGDDDPLGQRIEAGVRSYRVIGVMDPLPPDLPELRSLDTSILMPMQTSTFGSRPLVFTGFVEYEPGRRQEVTSALRAALDTLPTGPLFSIVTSEAWLGDPFVFRREVASGLGGAVLWTVALALVAAAANLANLFALRVYDRLGIIGVQRAVGATRRRVVEQVLAGILWLGLLGSLAGALLFALLLPVLQRSFGEQVLATPYSLGLAVAIGVATALAAGTAPAYWAVTLPVVQALRDKPRPLFREGVGLTGLIVGIGALIASTSIADGAERWVAGRIDELGGRRIVYSSISGPSGEFTSILRPIPLNASDFEAIHFPFIEAKALAAVGSAEWLLPEHADAQVRSLLFYVHGDFFTFASRPFIAGRVPTEPHEIVLGEDFAQRWFADREPTDLVGQTVYLTHRDLQGDIGAATHDARAYHISGIYRGGSWETFGDTTGDAAIKLHGLDDPSLDSYRKDLHLLIAPDTDFDAAIATLNAFLDARHTGRYAPAEATYPAGDLSPIRQALQQTSQGYRAVALVTLLVGGFGLANVMLLRVAKRRAEVGLRRAAGATRQKIIRLFLLESARLALLGGLAGLLAGALGAYLVASASPWQPFIAVLWLPLGLGTALVVGLLFGAYPAYQAAQLPPASALRSEG